MAIDDGRRDASQIPLADAVYIHQADFSGTISKRKPRIFVRPHSVDMRGAMIVQVDHDPVGPIDENRRHRL